MAEKFSDIYYPGMAPDKLADNVLKNAYGDGIPCIPIDPFKLMKKFGIVYQFMGFEDLEGIYIVPENEDDVPVVGISYKRKITRQRFTAAHELCHHIKDRRSEACPIGSSNAIERYAEKFAAELLMPRPLFLSVAQEYASDGRVTLDDALQIAECFGVSFRSCVLRLAYTFHLLDGEYANLNKGLFGQRLWFYSKTSNYTDALKISNVCVNCGLCSKVCPMDNIIMDKGKPKAGDRCTMCYRCINLCPQQAITLLGKEVVAVQHRFENYNQ